MLRKSVVVVLIIAMAAFSFSCSSSSKTKKGAVIGAAAGGVLGAVVGNRAGNTIVGAIVGAAVGGAAGAYIGNYMDNQADEMKEDIDGAKIERVGEGIKITFDSGILFDVNKSDLKPVAKTNLENLASILNKYEDTNILIEGHTDNTGSDEYNMQLSERRSQAVANYLATLNVDATRFTIMGYGESQPIATNETVEGRAQNRRVELAIMANEKLKKVAEEEAG